MILESLFVKLGYEYDEKKLEVFEESLEQTGKLLKTASLAALGLASALAIMLQKSASSALASQRYGEALNVTREEIVALERTSRDLAGNEDAIGGFVQRLVDARRELARGGRPDEGLLQAMALLNIQHDELKKRNPIELFKQMAFAFQDVGKETQLEDRLIRDLGLTNELILVFRKLQEGQIAANRPIDVDEAKIERVTLLFNDLKDSLSDSLDILLVEMLPHFEQVVKGFHSMAPILLNIAKTVADTFLTVGEFIGETIARIKTDLIDPINEMLDTGSLTGLQDAGIVALDEKGDIDFLRTLIPVNFLEDLFDFTGDDIAPQGGGAQPIKGDFIPTFDVLPEKGNKTGSSIRNNNNNQQISKTEITNNIQMDVTTNRDGKELMEEFKDALTTETRLAFEGGGN